MFQHLRCIMLPALAVALLTGCGHEHTQRLTHAQYLAALRAIEISPVVREVELGFWPLVTGLPPPACPAAAQAFADNVRDIVDAVARLDPPLDADDLQRRFVAAASQTAGRLDRLANDVAAGRVACGMPWNRRAYGLPSTRAAERVLTEYAQRGYLLNVNSGD